MDEIETRRCSVCDEDLPLDRFVPIPRGEYERPCKRCRNEKSIQRRRAVRLRGENELDYRLGLDRQWRVDRLREQGGGCAICGAPSPPPDEPDFSVDHDHLTGIFRALLCLDCNLSIGRMGDDPDRLRRAADYIEDHRSNPRDWSAYIRRPPCPSLQRRMTLGNPSVVGQ